MHLNFSECQPAELQQLFDKQQPDLELYRWAEGGQLIPPVLHTAGSRAGRPDSGTTRHRHRNVETGSKQPS